MYFPQCTLENDAQHRNDRRVVKNMQPLNRLINHLNKENARKLRKWESINMKIINATRANMFSQNCLREKLRPKINIFYKNPFKI